MKQITASDRALIEAALAAGKVTVVPRGVSSQAPGACMTWKEEREQFFKNQRRAALFRASAPTQREQRAATKARTADRRASLNAACLAMMAEGLSYRAIAQRLGMAVGPIYVRCQKLKTDGAETQS